jgi:tetratricopeptide (TPR) repeat protein
MSQPPSTGTPPREQVLLVAMQQPEYDLMNLSKLLASRGLSPLDQHPSGDPENPRWTFRTLDGKSQIQLQMFGELGVYRLMLLGAEAITVAQMIPQMLPVLSPNLLAQRVQTARAPEERQVLLALLLLCFPSASIAMTQLGPLLQQGDPEVTLGVIMGLRLMESAEAAEFLDQIVQQSPPESPVALAAADAYAALVALGVVKPKLDPTQALQEIEDTLDAKPDDALKRLQELSDAGFSSALASLLRARALAKLARWDEVNASLTPALSAPDTRARALLLRARLLERQGDPHGALAEVSAALRLPDAPPEAAALESRLSLLLDASQQSPTQQLSQLDLAVSSSPDDPELRLQRAPLLLLLSRPDDALADVKVALKRLPDDPRAAVLEVEANLQRGALLSALQRPTPAPASLPPSMRLQASLQRGRIYLALDDMDRASRAFAETLNRDAAPEAALGQALALDLLGANPALAQRLYARALDALPAADLLSSLRPTLYAAPPHAPAALSGIPLCDRPASRIGVDTIDPLFKYCLDCGTAALNRRTQCKACGSKTFLEAR